MNHNHIVKAGDLERYAPTRESQAVIPELIYHLVRQSCSNLVVCRIPYGDAVNQPGWDGIVEAKEGFCEFVPKGRSYWEIGTGANPQHKATADFKKRTKAIDDAERAKSAFVFVTPRSSGSGSWNVAKQDSWIEQRKKSGWKLIRIIDGVKLADWLREFPAIGKWMAKELGLTANLRGLSTAAEHWENLTFKRAKGDPPLPPKLFTVGREAACTALQGRFAGETKPLMLRAESRQDVADFVAAFLVGLDKETSSVFSNRCLYINDEQAWRSIVETRSQHVLVADTKLGLETEEGAELLTIARRTGHAVVVPLCGAWSGKSPEILKLRSPSKSQIESTLKEAGYIDIRASELANIGGVSAIRRHFQGYDTLPPYATWDNATSIAQAGLIGKWDGSNPIDRAALEVLLGKEYGGWIEILRPDTLRADTPLIQNNERWKFVARGEAWDSLGCRITDDDLDRFQTMAINVLGERDPQFDLPKEERFFASIRGKALTHSSLIREGVAETLALIGSRPKPLTLCSTGKAETTAVLVVRDLLHEASWDRWASLDSLMPLLAEAAPDEFLDAVESCLVNLDKTPFHKIFAEEGGGGVDGRNYMSGLLWALEALAWSPELLSRVSVVLADIASFDPGGNWANRPLNSLVGIFLPWHVQTTAPFEKRKSAVESVIKEQPTVGWKLLLALLPHNHGLTMGCYHPVWRNFIPQDWNKSISIAEYWEQIDTYAELAITLARCDSEKLCELIERLSELPKSSHESLLKYLDSDKMTSLPEADRLPLWESLDKLVKRHRKFSNADWALPEDSINEISKTAEKLAPISPVFRYHHLFSGRDSDLYDGKESYDNLQKRLDKARQDAMSEIIGNGDIDVALSFAASVASPDAIGRALGVIATTKMENTILPSLLDAQDDISIRVVAGFVWARFWNLEVAWVDGVLKRKWSSEQQSKFLTLLPFREEIWERVLPAHEALYWKNAHVNPYAPDGDLTIAIEKLLEYGREGVAVMCVARTVVDGNVQFNESLATRALLAVLKSSREIEELDNYQTVELIKHLQESELTDKEALFQIEWNFLPWLGQFSSASPVTLEKRLASNPAFFVEVIQLVFRSKNANTEDCAQPNEQKKYLANLAYKLLMEWERCPGIEDDGTFNAETFNMWIHEVRKLTEESGHANVAQSQIGHVLTCAPADPDGLWIHNAVAEVLNSRDTEEMRFGFTTQLFKDRGLHGFTRGEAERELASKNREKAEQLDAKGYTRFATAMREFAEEYERQAEREAERNPYGD